MTWTEKDWQATLMASEMLRENAEEALAAERDRANRAEARLAAVSDVVRANGSATAQKIVEILAIKAKA